MGKQLYFYMTGDDESEFVDFLRKDDGVILVKYISHSESINIIESLPPQGEPFWGTLWLWNSLLSPVPKLRYISKQKYYTVDEIMSEVIQFSRSHFDEGRLVRGSIWTEFNGWQRSDPSIMFSKSDQFKKWFSRISGWIKRNSIKDSSNCCLMPGAVHFRDSGGQLVQGVMKSGRAI